MEYYTTREILEKYQITDYIPKGTARFITYMKKRGINVKLVSLACGRKPSYYAILDDNLDNDEIWADYPPKPEWQFSNKGNVRNKITQKFYRQGQKTSDGYYKIDMGDNHVVRVHRGVMESFYPIDNPQKYVVDHINGKRNDNRLENLRWVYQTDNCQFSDKNNTKLKEILAKLIQKYGYEATEQKLLELL